MATFKELLQECRDEFMPLLVGAIEGDHDPDWAGAYMVSDEFHPMLRSSVVLLPTKMTMSRLLEVANEDEKKVLQGDKAAPYIDKLKTWLIEFNRALKASAAEEAAPQTPTPAGNGSNVPAAAPSPKA